MAKRLHRGELSRLKPTGAFRYENVHQEQVGYVTYGCRTTFSREGGCVMVGRGVYHRRAKPSGVHLTGEDASLIKGMRLRGDRQHDIAAWFGVNPGRIAEVLTGHLFGCITPGEAAVLPPAGPYHSGRAAYEAVQALADAKAALALAERRIRSAAG